METKKEEFSSYLTGFNVFGLKSAVRKSTKDLKGELTMREGCVARKPGSGSSEEKDYF